MIFNIGIKVILIITAIFFMVFFYLCFLWSDVYDKAKRIEIAAMLSFIYSFTALSAGVLALTALIFIIKYAPSVLQLIKAHNYFP